MQRTRAEGAGESWNVHKTGSELTVLSECFPFSGSASGHGGVWPRTQLQVRVRCGSGPWSTLVSSCSSGALPYESLWRAFESVSVFRGRPAGFSCKSQRNEQMQIKFWNVNLLENGRIISFFLFSTRRAAQTKKLEFLIKLVTLNVCARGSRDFPATPHPTDTVFVPGLSFRIPNLVCV